MYTGRFGEKVVMMGSGQVGVEVAMHLGDIGHAVNVLRMMDNYVRNALWSHKEVLQVFKPDGMRIHCSIRVTEVTLEGVKAVNPDGEGVSIRRTTDITLLDSALPSRNW